MRNLAFAVALGVSTGVCSGAEFALDTSHTAVHFAVSHFDISKVRGRIMKLTGLVAFDPVAKSGSIDIRADPDTIDTGNRTLDQILRSDQFLDTARYGDARYAGNRFVYDGDRLVAIDGTLFLHGVTRPVRLAALSFTCKEVTAGIASRHVCGGEFQATIRRSEFGMTRFPADVGDDVELTISVEASRQ